MYIIDRGDFGMQSIYEQVVAIVGEVPAGFEPVVYLACLFILVFLLSTGFRILFAVLGWVGGQ